MRGDSPGTSQLLEQKVDNQLSELREFLSVKGIPKVGDIHGNSLGAQGSGVSLALLGCGVFEKLRCL